MVNISLLNVKLEEPPNEPLLLNCICVSDPPGTTPPTWLSTYALIDCCVAKDVAELVIRSSSSKIDISPGVEDPPETLPITFIFDKLDILDKPTPLSLILNVSVSISIVESSTLTLKVGVSIELLTVKPAPPTIFVIPLADESFWLFILNTLKYVEPLAFDSNNKLLLLPTPENLTTILTHSLFCNFNNNVLEIDLFISGPDEDWDHPTNVDRFISVQEPDPVCFSNLQNTCVFESSEKYDNPYITHKSTVVFVNILVNEAEPSVELDAENILPAE